MDINSPRSIGKMKRSIAQSIFLTIVLCFAQQANALYPKDTITEQRLIDAMQKHKPIYIQHTIHAAKVYHKITSIPKKIIESDATINSLIFKFPINISNRPISHKIFLAYSQFLQNITLQNISFKQPVNISMTYFAKPIEGHNLRFYEALNFRNCYVAQAFRLSRTVFFSNVKFTSSIFNETTNLPKSTFKKNVDFSGTTFRKGLNLEWSEFDEKANLNNIVLDGSSNLSHMTFNHGLDLSNSTLHGTINLFKSFINGKLNLKNLTIAGKNKLDLRNIEPLLTTDKIPINLENVTLPNVLLNYHFLHLYFDKGTSYINTLKTYTNLLEYFKKEGSTESYNKLFKEYKSYKFKFHRHYIQGFLSKHLWDHGLNKGKVINWIILLYIFFTCINAAMFPLLATDYAVISFFSDIHFKSGIQHNMISRFIFYLPFSAFFTLFLMAGGILRLGLSISKLKGHNILILSYLLTVCILGFFSMLFLISFIL